MPGSDNLIKMSELTAEERRERTSKAGKASVEARREKKQLRECLEILMSSEVTRDKSGAPVSGSEAMAAVLFKAALKGDWKAWELARDTSGQKPVEKIVVAEVDQEIIDEVEGIITGAIMQQDPEEDENG